MNDFLGLCNVIYPMGSKFHKVNWTATVIEDILKELHNEHGENVGMLQEPTEKSYEDFLASFPDTLKGIVTPTVHRLNAGMDISAYFSCLCKALVDCTTLISGLKTPPKFPSVGSDILSLLNWSLDCFQTEFDRITNESPELSDEDDELDLLINLIGRRLDCCVKLTGKKFVARVLTNTTMHEVEDLIPALEDSELNPKSETAPPTLPKMDEAREDVKSPVEPDEALAVETPPEVKVVHQDTVIEPVVAEVVGIEPPKAQVEENDISETPLKNEAVAIHRLREPTPEEMAFAREYPRIAAGHNSITELVKFFGWPSEKRFTKLRDICKAIGEVRELPEWTVVTLDDISTFEEKLLTKNCSENNPLNIEVIADLHRALSVFRATHQIKLRDKVFVRLLTSLSTIKEMRCIELKGVEPTDTGYKHIDILQQMKCFRNVLARMEGLLTGMKPEETEVYSRHLFLGSDI